MSAVLTVVVPVWGAYARFLPECLAAADVALAGVDADRLIVAPDPLAVPAGWRVLPWSGPPSVAAMRNAGLREATGEWCLFLDVDDTLHSDGIRALLARAGDVVVVAGRLSRVLEYDDPAAARHWPPAYAVRLAAWRPALIVAHAWRNLVPVVTGGIVRRSTLQEVGGFSEDYDEDWLLAAKLLRCGDVRLTADAIGDYRAHVGSLSRRPVPDVVVQGTLTQVLDVLAGAPRGGALLRLLRPAVGRLQVRRRLAISARFNDAAHPDPPAPCVEPGQKGAVAVAASKIVRRGRPRARS